MPELLPVFLNLAGRPLLMVGGGPVAAAKLQQLLAAGATAAAIRVVAPSVDPTIERAGVRIDRRRFEPCDLDGALFVIAAATPEVNRDVAAAADERRVFVNAVDDPANASAFLGGVLRRGGVTVAISTNGEAPGLAGLLREALDAVLPREIGVWLAESRRQRPLWRRDRVPMHARRPLLLRALNDLYSGPEPPGAARDLRPAVRDAESVVNTPSAPENSWP
jgi:siroheme synthase-like protein